LPTSDEAYSQVIDWMQCTPEVLMQKQSLYANPFALMMDPQAVLQAMERSERLNRLQSRVCRPLDKPLIPLVQGDRDAFDESVDAADDEPESGDR
jgi:hypothetical protein